jgi:Xaa-Pro aminopeptidase
MILDKDRTNQAQNGVYCKPGIYIEDEKMGIRIENNVWITKMQQDLMKNIPVTVEEIEALMKK